MASTKPGWWKMRPRAIAVALAIVGLSLLCVALAGCKDTKKLSEQHARMHVEELAKKVAGDVEEVRKGLPQGAKHLVRLFKKKEPREEKAADARGALERARNKVQDLRVAKSTFFAVAGTDGVVIRNDQDQDRMASKGLFGPFPGLKQALSGKYVETRGVMAEASGVKGKPDGQWIAAQAIKVDDEVRGLYVTGWSWAAYAYRLEFSLRNDVKSGLEENDKMPLVYVFVVVDKNVYGAPVSPQVSAEAIAALDPISKLQGDVVYSTVLEVTGRGYGLAVKATPALGSGVGVAVLWSET